MQPIFKCWTGRVLREGDVLVVCEVKTRTGDACGRRTRRSTRPRWTGSAGWPTSGWPATPADPRDVRVDLVAVTRPRRALRVVEHVAGDRLMSGRDGLRHLAAGRDGSPDRGAGRRLERRGRHDGGRAGRRRASTRRASAAGWRSSTVGWSGRAASGSRSCCRRPTWPSGAPTSTWPSPSRCWRPTASAAPELCRQRCSSGELTLAGGLRCRAGGAADGAVAARHGHPPGVRARAAGPRGGHGARRRWCSGCAPWPRWSRSSRRGGARGAAGGAGRGSQPADVARGSRVSTSSTSRDLAGMADTRYAVEVAAAGGHHVLLSGPRGTGKTSIAERMPGLLPDLTPGESLELTAIHSLAGILDPAGGDAHAPAVLRAPPRRQQGQPARWRHRPGPSRGDQPGPLRGAVPRRVPAVPRRRDRGAAPAAGER